MFIECEYDSPIVEMGYINSYFLQTEVWLDHKSFHFHSIPFVQKSKYPNSFL